MEEEEELVLEMVTLTPLAQVAVLALIVVLLEGLVALMAMTEEMLEVLLAVLVVVEQGPLVEILLEHITITMVVLTEVTKAVMGAMAQRIITELALM
jgi:hypothetical protein